MHVKPLLAASKANAESWHGDEVDVTAPNDVLCCNIT